MMHLRESLPTSYTKTLLDTYFNSQSAEQLYPGSVLSVQFDGGSFAGVLISIRHKGVDTSFTLRNVIQRTGVEMRFTVGSPLIKEVKVISRAGGEDSARREEDEESQAVLSSRATGKDDCHFCCRQEGQLSQPR